MDPGAPGGDVGGIALVEHDRKTGFITVLDAQNVKFKGKEEGMSERVLKMRKYQDAKGNVYGIEKAVRNGRYVIIRTNNGGNRKAAKEFTECGSAPFMQKLLDDATKNSNWTEVTE